MAIKLAAGALGVVVLAVLLQGCLFGGGDGGGGSLSSVARSGAIPTATPPSTLPEPILLGQGQATGGGSGTVSNTNAPTTYTVKPGETLGAIASGQGVAGDQQAAWILEVLRLNGIDDARLLKAGQELQLPRLPTQVATRPAGTPGASGTQPARTGTPGTATPVRTTTGGTPSAGASATPTRAAGASGNTYTVQSGDIPLTIAQKLGVPESQQVAWANQLLTLNNANASGLAIGQVLQLPPIPAAGSSTSPSASSTPPR